MKMFVNVARLDIGQLFTKSTRRGHPFTLDTFLVSFSIVIVYCIHIWATSWESLFMPYANNKGTGQPAHPRSLISTFSIRCLGSIIPILANINSKFLRHWLGSEAGPLASEAKQAGLSLTWLHNSKGRFSHDMSCMSLVKRKPAFALCKQQRRKSACAFALLFVS